MLFGRTPHDDRSDTMSFFLGKVKYPLVTKTTQRIQSDVWDKYFVNDTKADWKIV